MKIRIYTKYKQINSEIKKEYKNQKGKRFPLKMKIKNTIFTTS